MNIEDFKKAMTPKDGERFEYPCIDDIKTMAAGDRLQAIAFMRKKIISASGISKEYVSILFSLDPGEAISLIDKDVLRSSSSWAALVQYYHEASKVGADSDYLELVKDYPFMDKEGRNQFWFLLPSGDMPEKDITELESVVLGESDKLPKAQGIQALLKARGVKFGTNEYKALYQKLSLSSN